MPPGAVVLATRIAAAVYALLHLDVGWFPDTAPTELGVITRNNSTGRSLDHHVGGRLQDPMDTLPSRTEPEPTRLRIDPARCMSLRKPGNPPTFNVEHL